MEPALDLALPQVYRQPPKPVFTRGRAPVGRLVRQAQEAHADGNAPQFGQAYGELLVECQPALAWAYTCWDYLLSTEGCRFIPREMGERRYHRCEYRVVTEADYRRLIHRVFKERLLDYQPAEHGPSFIAYLRQAFWPALRERYRELDQPLDPRQRRLTSLSYLRCSPYRFLNDYHEQLVYGAVRKLPAAERRVIEYYYLRFYTKEAVSHELRINPEALLTRKTTAMRRLRGRAMLAYYLLLQIERY